jgi:hypothetical protein
MNKESSEIINTIESYLKGIAEDKIIPEEIGINITNLLIKKGFVNETFSIETIPIFDSYVLRSRNLYTTNQIGAMPSFCRVCGKLVGKTLCMHEASTL